MYGVGSNPDIQISSCRYQSVDPLDAGPATCQTNSGFTYFVGNPFREFLQSKFDHSKNFINYRLQGAYYFLAIDFNGHFTTFNDIYAIDCYWFTGKCLHLRE